jgi:hypothetical protein
MEDPEENQQQDYDRSGEDDKDCRGKSEEEGPVAPGVAMRLAQMAHHEAVVAAVGLPRDVEQVSEERDGADDDADAEVDRHAEQRDAGDAANPRSEDQHRGGDAGEHIAEAGHEANQAVEPDTNARAGDAEPVVEEVRVEVEILVGKEALEAYAQAARRPARGQNLRVGRGRHDSVKRRRARRGRGWARCAAMLQSRLERRL